MEFLKKLRPRITSRRERMTYWMIVVGVFMFLVSAIAGLPLLEVVPFYGAISLVAGWYLQKETDRNSIKEI